MCVKYFTVFCLFCFVACKNKSIVSEEVIANGEKSTISLKVNVDNLHYREGPSTSYPVVGKLPVNTLLEWTGEVSEHEDEILISGQMRIEPWYEIIYRYDTAWVYGGAVDRIEENQIRDDHIILPGRVVGRIDANDTEDSLIVKFGQENVVRDQIQLFDGEFALGSIVYPNSNKELKILWKDNNFVNLFSIEMDRSDSHYRTIEGVRIGMPIDMVENINKRVFSILGFDWNLSGKLFSWEGGVLSDKLVVFFKTTQDDYSDDLQGDVKLFSDNYKFDYAKPVLSKIKVYMN